MNLKHPALLDHVHDYRYQIENYAIAKLDGSLWNLALEGNWYTVDE